MATQGFRVIRDENRGVHCGGMSFDKEANDSKTVRKPGPSGSRPLSNITNSGKPSHANVLKKNFATKASDIGVYGGSSVPQQNSALDAQKKGPLGTRKVLADISNSKKSTAHQTSFLQQSNVPDVPKKTGGVVGRRALADISNTKKSSQGLKSTCSKKLDNIVEEQFLHNHQVCVDTVRRGLDVESFYTALGFNDDFSVEPGTPLSLPKSDEPKAGYASPPKYMEYEDVPDFLDEAQFSSYCGALDVSCVCHPFPSGHSSPDFKLRMSP